jgi:hypothetical protein
MKRGIAARLLARYEAGVSKTPTRGNPEPEGQPCYATRLHLLLCLHLTTPVMSNLKLPSPFSILQRDVLPLLPFEELSCLDWQLYPPILVWSVRF